MKPRDTETKRQREKALVGEMIALYCKKRHGGKHGLCPECQALLDYAPSPRDQSPVMETNTYYSKCPVHCYKPEMREKIRQVMAFAGPRMLFVHPGAAIRHVIETKREQKRLERKRK